MAQSYLPGEEVKYKGWFQAGRIIAQEEGAAALWKGIVPRLTRLAPGQAITWTVVMRVTSFFENSGVLAEDNKHAAAPVAGAVAAPSTKA